MAAEQMKKVASHLTCPVCYELYKKPKYLPCYHSYCEECLVKLQKPDSDSITCPECRKTSVIPSGGIRQLPNNFFINRIVDEVALKEKVTGEEDVRCDLCIREDPAVVLCFDCGIFLCNYCNESHKYSKEYRGHSLSQLRELRSEKKDVYVRPKAKPLLCQEHDMELNFYCATCEQLVCHYCITTDHGAHEHNTIKKMANKHRADLDKVVEPVEKMIAELSKTHQKVTASREEIQMQATEVDQQIDYYYDQLQQQLLQQREDLKKELHEVSTQKKKVVSLQLEEIEHTQAQLSSIRELNNAVKNGTDQEALFMKKQITEDVKRLTDFCNKLTMEPEELATFQFISAEEYHNFIPQFANVFYGDAAPLHSVAEKIPALAYANECVNLTIVTKNVQGHLCCKGGSKVIAQTQPSSTEDFIPVIIRDNEDGSYLVSFVPRQSGKLKLSVVINGKHIKDSPYSITVHRDYSVLRSPSKILNDDGRMGRPWGIAFGKDGMWAVTDYSNHCVYIFDKQDQLIKKFGSEGKDDGQFDSPSGLAFDANNHLYVVCKCNHRVQKFTIDGEYLLKFGGEGFGHNQLDYPSGVMVHKDRIYVVDKDNRISVFLSDGKFIQSIGNSDHLTRPFDIAVSDNNQLLVANCNKSISVYSFDGHYINSIGTGHLWRASGIAIDMHGCILVTEFSNSRVSVFDRNGVFKCFFGSKGSADGQFNHPIGIALDPNENIYICDRDNGRIQIFLV